MLKNYFKIAYRNLKRRKGYALINIFGLAAGMAACLLIGLYVRYELSYDVFHEKAERIYRVDTVSQQTSKGFIFGDAWIEIETGPALKAGVPAIQKTVRIKTDGPQRLQQAGRTFIDLKGLYTSSHFFDVFSFTLVEGNQESLERPYTTVLTRSLAKKIFGNGEVVGQTVSAELYGRPTTLEVTGIVENVPSNSHFTFDFLVSLETLRGVVGGPNFYAKEVWTYVLLREGVDPASLETEMQKVVSNMPAGPNFSLALHPLTKLHLYYWAPRQGDPRYLYLFGAVAVVILLIACANYTNLATARSMQRAREVGVRKVVGAHRTQLAGQFLGESVFLSVLALPLAVLLLYLVLPIFNAVVGASIAIHLQGNLDTLFLLIGLAVAVGLAAGSYPALFLSRFRPVEVLRERLPSGWTGARLRKGLTIFQFTLSAALLFSMTVILQQLDYIQQKNLGFNEERVIALPLRSRALSEQAGALKQELLRLPHIQQATLASGLPGFRGFGGWSAIFPWKHQKMTLHRAIVDPAFIETLGMHLLAGRGFSAARPADSSAFVLNEAAAQALGGTSPEAAVGQSISFFGDTWRIIGVVENFYYQSLHHEIAPLALQLGSSHGTVALRIEAGHIAGTLERVQQTWEQFTEMPFAYQFLDERIDQLYQQERRTAKILGGFAGLALLLACLGLFALATYAVERRTKEIGIRKTFGASVPSIVALLSKDFLKLVLVAFVIAAPLAYFAMQRWLQDFAYHVSLGPGLFLLVGAGVLLVALLTVSYQAVKAALADPVDSLRYE